jgi:hypothetical protein
MYKKVTTTHDVLERLKCDGCGTLSQDADFWANHEGAGQVTTLLSRRVVSSDGPHPYTSVQELDLCPQCSRKLFDTMKEKLRFDVQERSSEW